VPERKCTCTIVWPHGKASLPAIEGCPLCKAAPELLEACKFTLEIIESNLPELSDGSMAMQLRKAIAKAEDQ
jgi:glutaredoxin